MKSDEVSIREVWTQIEDWLTENAPQLLKNLNSPATIEEIEQTEIELGIKFPDEVRDSYLIHNGSENWLFFGDDFLSLKRLIYVFNRSKLWYEDSRYSDPSFLDYEIEVYGNVKKQIWNSKWIPLFSDSNMFLDLLDLDPPQNGIYGQIISINEDIERISIIKNNLLDYFSNFLYNLQCGNYIISENRSELWRSENYFN